MAEFLKIKNETFFAGNCDDLIKIEENWTGEIKVERDDEGTEDIQLADGSLSSHINSGTVMETNKIIKKEEDDFGVAHEVHQEVAVNNFCISIDNREDFECYDKSFHTITVCNEENEVSGSGHSTHKVEFGCDDKSFPSTATCVEENEISGSGHSTTIFSTLSSVHSGENSLIKSHKSKLNYDKRIKLVDVSVVLEDLFSNSILDSLQKPLEKHIQSKYCICIFCTDNFKLQKEVLEKKNNKDRWSVKSDIADEHCATMFRTAGATPQHPAGHLENKKIVCEHCCTNIEKNDELKHRLMSDTNEKGFSCEYCFATFMKNTESRKHLDLNEKFTCEHCDASFDVRSSLLSHLATHTSKKPSLCLDSSTELKQPISSKCHLMTHNNPFSCTHCPAEFNVDDRSFSCKYCSSKFSTRNGLKIHLMIHTKERPLSCTHCPTNSSLRNRLKSHMMAQTNESPFTCMHCPAKFILKSRLKIHMMLHTNENTLPCPHCPAKVRTKKGLKIHLMSHFTVTDATGAQI